MVAAVPGFIDWLAIPARTRAKRVGRLHMILNLIVIGLFVISLVARGNTDGGYQRAGAAAMVWGWLGIVLALVSSWLGGELVETLGIGVRDDAHPDAPSALSNPAPSSSETPVSHAH